MREKVGHMSTTSYEPPKLKHFDGITWAVFNCRMADKMRGKKAIIDKFGATGWQIVASNMKTGIMELFHHAPVPETILYAETVAKSADDRKGREKSKEAAMQSEQP